MNKNFLFIIIGIGLLLLALGGTQSVCVNKAKTIKLQAEYETYCAITKVNNEKREKERKALLKENEKLQKEIEVKAEAIAKQKKEIYSIYTKLEEAEEIIPVTENEKILSKQLKKCKAGFKLSLGTIEDLEKNNFSLTEKYDNQVIVTDTYIKDLADERRDHKAAQKINKRLNRELKIERMYNKVYKVIAVGGIAFVIYSIIIG